MIHAALPDCGRPLSPERRRWFARQLFGSKQAATPAEAMPAEAADVQPKR